MKRSLFAILPLFLLGTFGWAVDKVKDTHKHGKEVHKHDAEEPGHEEHGHEEEAHKHEKSEASHDHKEGEEHEEHGKGEEGHDEHDHAEKSHGHGDEEGHEHEEEGGSRIGPDKGIQAADEKNGFKLSPEAVKNFELKNTKLEGSGPWKLPISARLMSGEEINIYRLRDGFYKRIDFRELSKDTQSMSVSASELKAGDEVVVSGIGFLRIAEIAAFGGAPEGHHH